MANIILAKRLRLLIRTDVTDQRLDGLNKTFLLEMPSFRSTFLFCLFCKLKMFNQFETLRKRSLENRFLDFLEIYCGFESIDKMSMSQEDRQSTKADFLALNREYIIEIKSIETEKQQKIESILDKHRSRPEYPDFFGGWELHKILKYLPDGKEINREVYESVTNSVKDSIRKANNQIKNSKKIFGVQNSKGVLIFLNDSIDTISPEILSRRVRNQLARKTNENSPIYAEIDVVLMINETHFSQIKSDLIGFPCLIQPSFFKDSEAAQKFVSSLIQQWAVFNNAHHIQTELKTYDDVSKLNLISIKDDEKAKERRIPRHESWRRYYKRNSYFRSFDEEKLIWIYKIIMDNCSRSMLKGATKIERERAMFWMEVFTHFLEEVNHRGLDFKIFKSATADLGEDIEERMNKRFPEI